jgi:hypothetical protein
MATKYEALKKMRDTSITAAAVGQVAITAGYIWPEDYATYPDQPTTPFMLFSVLPVQRFQWNRRTHGLGADDWVAEILLPVHEGEFFRMDSQSAAAELKTRGWPLALSTKLFADMTLGGTVEIIGRSSSDALTLFDYQVGHLPIGARMYWGWRFEVMVRQVHTQPQRS